MLNSVDVPRTPWVDPILAQLHALREQLSVQHGNDMAEISRAAGVTAAKWGFVEKALPMKETTRT